MTTYTFWAVVKRGTDQFDIFSASTEEEILEACESEGYEVYEWCGTEEAAERAMRVHVLTDGL